MDNREPEISISWDEHEIAVRPSHSGGSLAKRITCMEKRIDDLKNISSIVVFGTPIGVRAHLEESQLVMDVLARRLKEENGKRAGVSALMESRYEVLTPGPLLPLWEQHQANKIFSRKGCTKLK